MLRILPIGAIPNTSYYNVGAACLAATDVWCARSITFTDYECLYVWQSTPPFRLMQTITGFGLGYGTFITISGACVNGEHLLVCDNMADCVYEFAVMPTLTSLRSFEIHKPVFVNACDDIILTCSRNIWQYDLLYAVQLFDNRTSELITMFGVGSILVNDIAIAPDGKHIIVASLGKEWLYSATGQLLRSYDTGCTFVRFNTAGDVFVGDQKNKRICVFSKNKPTRSLTVNFFWKMAVTKHLLFLMDRENAQVFEFIQ